MDEGAYLSGYSALIQAHDLKVPIPDHLCAIGTKHKKYDYGRWHIFTPRHRPEETLYGHLTFALTYEGIDLAILNALFQTIKARDIEALIRSEPTGMYSRKLWFLWEWLREEQLDIEDATTGNFIPLVNSKLQYEGKSYPSKRHRVRNNLPGTHNFCPLIRKTKKLERYIGRKLSETAIENIGQMHPDLLGRAAAFLLLKDSKASYTIEGEAPPHSRVERWGRIIGEAGKRRLSMPELKYLQQIVISDNRFIEPGLRMEGGFVGEHDRTTGMPMPYHISARADDLRALMDGLFETYELLNKDDFDATKQAEFFFECVAETVTKILPDEVKHLKKYDLINEFIKNYIDMPDKLVDLLIRFLNQNNGKLSKRATEREFNKLTDREIQAIEQKYSDIFS